MTDKKSLAKVTPATMLQIAVEQNADLEKLEKLMDLQERWENKEARKEYVAAMSQFRSECPTIEKTRTAHNNKYAGLAETLEQIKSLLAKNNLSHSWQTEQREGVIRVTCTVTHAAGHSESTSLHASPDTSGSKNAIQAIGSAVSYLERYTLFAILGLASQEMDNDGNPVTPQGVIDAIQKAKDMRELHHLFKEAWETYPDARKELTIIKDTKKREFEDAG